MGAITFSLTILACCAIMVKVGKVYKDKRIQKKNEKTKQHLRIV